MSATCTIDNVRIRPKLNTNNNLKAGSMQKYKQRRHVDSDKRKKKKHKKPSFHVNITSKKTDKNQTRYIPGLHVLEHLMYQPLCCILNSKLVLFCYSFYSIIDIDSVSTKRWYIVRSMLMNHIWFIMNHMCMVAYLYCIVLWVLWPLCAVVWYKEWVFLPPTPSNKY